MGHRARFRPSSKNYPFCLHLRHEFSDRVRLFQKWHSKNHGPPGQNQLVRLRRVCKQSRKAVRQEISILQSIIPNSTQLLPF